MRALWEMPKPSNDVQKELARIHGNAEWTIKDLRESLLKEIETIQAGESTESLHEKEIDLKRVTEIVTPRQYNMQTDTTQGSYILHCFVDSSTKG
jgi:hypothetical protein